MTVNKDSLPADLAWVVCEDYGSPRESDMLYTLTGSASAVRAYVIDMARASANGAPVEYERVSSFQAAEEGSVYVKVNSRMFSAHRLALQHLPHTESAS